MPAIHDGAATTRIGFRLYSLHAVDDTLTTPLGVLRGHTDLVHLTGCDAAAGGRRRGGAGDLAVAAAVETVHELDVERLTDGAEDHPESYATVDHAADIVGRYW